MLVLVTACNPLGYVKVKTLDDLLKNSPPTLTSLNCSSLALNEGDPLSCTAVGDDDGDFTYRFSSQNTCLVTLDADSGAITAVTNNSFVPGCVLAVEAFDGELTSNALQVSITVANSVPTLSIADVSWPEDTVQIRDDGAVESSEGDNGVYSLDNATTTGTKCSSVGTLSIDATSGAVSLNAPDWVGTCNVTVKYDDGNGGVVSTQFAYTATAVNDGPIISGACSGSINQDAAYSCSALTANDPEGDSFTWEFAPAHDCTFLSINASNGAITGTPDDEEVGSCTLAVRGTDGTSYSQVVYSRIITVNNLQPTLTISNKTTGDTIGPVVIATDGEVQSNEEGHGVYSIDNTTVTGNKCSDEGLVTINSSNGEITFDGTDGWSGSCNIKVIFDDQNPTLNTVSAQFTLTVQDTVGPKVINVSSLLADDTYHLGTTVSVQVTFDEPVVVTGTPRILLETGFVDRYATYVSGSGSANLTFNYVVQSDDFSSDLDVAATPGAIELNSGTLADVSTNNATLTLPVGSALNSLATNKNIVVSGNFSFATLSNVPSPIARTSLTDMEVGGSGVVAYKYKWGLKASTNCSDATGYSAETPISQKIIESLTSVVVGNSVVFCVVGKNGSNVWQPYSAATQAEWIKGEYSMGPISLAGLSNLPNWKDVAIDSFGRIVARNARGEIFRSVDNGTSWQLQCKITNDDNAHFKVDPSATGYTYIVTGGNLRKIEPYNGAACPLKTSTITDFNYTFFSSPVDIDSEGSIYLFIADAAGTKDHLYKSIDQGETWNLVVSLSGDGWSSSFAIDPNDKNKMVRFAADDVNMTRQGSYTSTNAGATWTRTTSTDLTLVDIKFNPIQPNTFYVHNGNYSVDGGANILLGVNTNIVTDMRRFHIDSNGSGYFLQESGTDTLLRKSTNYGVVAHSLLYTFPGVSSDKNSQAISVRGNVIAAVLGGRMYVSTNAGTSFNLINWQGTKLALMTGITTKDGKTVYGVTADWNIVKSSDIGESWELKYTYGRGCFGKEPRIDTHELEANRFSVWANGTNCAQYVSSVDSGTTVSTGLLANSWNFQTHIYNPLDSNFEGFRSQNKYRQTNDGGYDWRSFTYPSTNATGPDGYLDSQNGNIQWFMETSGFGNVVSTSQATLAQGNVATGLSTISGIDAFVNESGVFEVRVIDRAGKVRRSLNQGATFTDLGTSPALPNCSTRFFYSLPQNRNVMAMICSGGDDLTFTVDNGQTWRTIDFDNLYGINCDASGIALHPNKFFVACKSYDVLYVKYNAIELINDATDSIISSADQATPKPVVTNTIANEFNSTEYAIIPLGGTCDNSLTFSTTVPLSNDPAFSVTGNYQVCVRLTDTSNVVSFDRSPIIKFDGTAPGAPTFNLAGALSDTILKRHEYLDDGSSIVSGIGGTGFDKSSFAIIPSTGTCNNSHRYSYALPIGKLSNQFVSITEGSWKICMKLSDQAGNGEVFAQSPNFTYSNAAVYSKLQNLPNLISNVLSLNVTVGGAGVTSYRHKLGLEANTDCSLSSGYSAPVGVGTPISDSLLSYKQTNLELASFLKLCVVGADNDGNWQPMKEATNYSWSLYRYSAEKITLSDVTEIENWRNGWIDLHNFNIFYATDMSGMIHKSSNGGDSWTKVCRVPVTSTWTYSGDFGYRQSHYSDKNLYVWFSNEVYRIEDKDGKDCISITADLGNIPNTSGNLNFHVGPNGTLYALVNDSSEMRDSIYKSTNQGLSWNRVGDGIIYLESSSPSIAFRPDPVVAGRLYATFIHTSRPDLYGIYRSDNDGASWTKLMTSTGRLFLTPALQTPGKWSAYNLSNSSQSICTTDNWATSSICGRYNSEGFTELNQGRFQSLSDDIYSTFMMGQAVGMAYFELRKFPAGDNSSAVGIGTIPMIPIKQNYPIYAVQGSSVIASAAGRMFISTNGGSSFKRVKSANPEAMPLTLEGARFGGKGLMAISTTGVRKAYMSHDSGETWKSFYDPRDRCYEQPSFATGDMEFSRFAAFGLYSCGGIDNFSAFSDDYVTKSAMYGIGGQAIDITNAENGYFFSTLFMGRTTSYWQHYDYKNFVMPYVFPGSVYLLSPSAFVDPRDSRKFFMLTKNQNNDVNYPVRLALVDYENSTWTDLKANSNFPVISGIAMAHDGSGGHYLYSMAHDGKVERSSDYGNSFSIISNTAINNSSYCNAGRSYYVDPEKPQFQQTSCTEEAFSIDGGQSFTRMLRNFQTDPTFAGCALIPKYFDGKHIYLKCSVGILKMNVTDFELALGANDRNLDVSEQGANLPLVQVTEPGFYTSIEYAVVAANVTCDNSLSYSSTVPTTADAAFTTSGKYKVCIKYNDGSVKYTETSQLNYTSGGAVFTSIALVNDVADSVLTENERQDGHRPLVSNLVASNYTFVEYQVADSAAACSALSDYKDHPPLANMEGYKIGLSDGNAYKVCVKLNNAAGPIYGASSDFTYEENFPHAELVTKLGIVEKNVNFSSLVSGPDITHYRYKYGLADSLQCASDTQYSSSIPVATVMNLPLATAELNKKYKLCLVGKNNLNEWQPLHMATEYNFVVNKFRMTEFSPGTFAVANWMDVAIHDTDPSYMALMSFSGDIYRTRNGGVNWDVLCRINAPTNYTANQRYKLLIANDSQKTVYLSGGSSAGGSYRADNSGGFCTKIANQQIALNSLGHVYALSNYLSNFPTGVFRSSNRGVSWNLLMEYSGSSVDAVIHVSRNDDDNIIVLTQSGAGAIFETVDGGTNWVSRPSLNSFLRTQALISSPLLSRTFFQPLNANVYTTDGGATTTTGTAQGLAFRGDGKPYRLRFVSANQSVLETNTDVFNAATWTTVYTFNHQSFQGYDNLVVNGNTIAVILGRKLFLSTDGGATFTEQNISVSRFAFNSFERSQSKLYGVTNHNVLFSSADNGATWNLVKQINENPELVRTLGVAPSGNGQMVIGTGGSLYVSPDAFSTITRSIVRSSDGACLYYNIANPDQIIFSVAMSFYMTTDGLASDSASMETVSHACYSNDNRLYINPANTNQVWSANSSSQVLYNVATNASTTPATGLPTSYADTEMFEEGGNYVMRFIDIRGNLRESTNFGATSVSIGSLNPYSTSDTISNSKMNSEPTNRSFIINHAGNAIAYTSNEGASWDQFKMDSVLQAALGCSNFNDIIPFNDGSQKAMVACSSDVNATRPFVIEF
ncbi:putative Ig domain-containing protein [Peredibacter sp. HCB2-198]|uniref:putative Ig domain-containing protein n=1 Tax=Peredibacter sp. HCB2-198 TaxID=3383025 RepID=UPI0038B5E5F1